MSGLKKLQPELRANQFGTNPPYYAITADEMDKYGVYYVINPAQGASGAGLNWVGTGAISGTSGTTGLVVINAILDYPRNLEFAVTGTGAGMAGTASIVGRDQFGSIITEVISIGTASNGGTTAGTKVFAQITSGTFQLGTAVGNGTTRIGVGTTGTTTLFGLPDKIGGTTDLKILTVTSGTGALTINGGTIAAFVDVPTSSIKAPVNVTGTYSLMAWYKTTANPEAIPIVTNLPQRT